MPQRRVLVIGGSGNFGKWTCRLLAKAGHAVICGGRDSARLERAMTDLRGHGIAEGATLDINGDLDAALASIKPDIVIHTTGPFQTQDYRVAQACIRAGAHYLDLSDARAFTAGIGTLDKEARAAGVLVVSGASTVPGLTSALMAACRDAIPEPERLDYGIAAAQQTRQGVATAAAVLSYAGAPFETLSAGKPAPRVGWTTMRRAEIAGLGARWIADCDIPDLALFPKAYPTLRDIRFGAGVELSIIVAGFRLIAAARRLGLIRRPERLAPFLTRLSALFDPFGSDQSGFYFDLRGTGSDGAPARRRFDLVAKSGDGPMIPCLPAVVLAGHLAGDTINRRGAFACMELVGLDELLNAMAPLDISWRWSPTTDQATA